MKIKNVILSGTLLIGLVSFAQKDELKSLRKLYTKDQLKTEDVAEFKSLSAKLDGLATEESDKKYAAFYKSQFPYVEVLTINPATTPESLQNQLSKIFTPQNVLDMVEGITSMMAYEKTSSKKVLTSDLERISGTLKQNLINVAIALGNVKKYGPSAQILYAVYKLDSNEPDNLYFAANYAVEAKDYESALKYYKELIAINYTGEATLFTAVNKAGGNVESFKDKATRDKLVEIGSYSNPGIEKVPSRKGEIMRNVALILIETGKIEEAKTAISQARKENPTDDGLIVSEADIYLKLNDIPTYQRLIKEALDKNPNDAGLIFNLGVTSANNKQFDEAEKYYKRVIEIDPKYVDAYLNLSDAMLKPDQKMVDEMAKLGYTEKDQKRFEYLKGERQKLFNKVLPYLEKAHELKPDNKEVINGLITVYKFLERMDKVKEMKAKL